MSYEDVLERLIEASGFLRRMPDRERGWLRDPRSPWPEIMRHSWFGDYPDVEPEDRPTLPGLRSIEVDRMNEALGWLEWTPTRDRKLIGLVLAQLERGETRPAWRSIERRLKSGRHPDTLAKRFDRALAIIAAKLNATNGGAKSEDFRA